MNTVLNKTPKHGIWVRISAHFTLLGLGATVKAAAIAHFSYGNALKSK